jgi:predicted dehydrogenase
MPSASSQVPVAVIGVGEHGKKHARAFTASSGAHLVGVYDIVTDRCQAVAGELGVRAFPNLGETLEHARAVSIVIPTTSHLAVAREAIARGVDVLVEKPITVTLAEADELINCAADCQVVLQVGHVERFNPGARAAKAVTRNPLFFEVHRLGVFSPRSLDVDVVFDLMIHDLDLVLWMVESPVREVRAVGLPVLSSKVDIANARVEFENGTVANFTASRVSTERVRKFRYFQPNEYISIDFARRDAIALSVDRANSPTQIGYRKLGGSPGTSAVDDPLQAQIDAFVSSVETRECPLVSGEEGRAALALAEQVMSCIEQHAAALNVPLDRAPGSSGEI